MPDNGLKQKVPCPICSTPTAIADTKKHPIDGRNICVSCYAIVTDTILQTTHNWHQQAQPTTTSSPVTGSSSANVSPFILLAGILMLAGFFMPWFTMKLVAFSGLDLPELARKLDVLASAADAVSKHTGSEVQASGVWVYYAIYCIPVLAALMIVARLSIESRIPKCAVGFSASLITLAVMLVLFFKTVDYPDVSCGIGYWVTIGGAAIALISSIVEYIATEEKEKGSRECSPEPASHEPSEPSDGPAHAGTFLSNFRRIIELWWSAGRNRPG